MLRNLHVPDNTFEWVDIVDPTREELVQLGKDRRLHPNTLRDCLQPDHLPKFESTPDEVSFVIFRLLSAPGDEQRHTVQDMTTKIAVFYRHDLLVTVHRKPMPFLEEIQQAFVETGRADETSEVVTKILWHTLNSYENYVQELSAEVDFFEQGVFLAEPPRDLERRLYFLRRKASVLREMLDMTGHVIVKLTTTPDDASALQDARELHTQLLGGYTQVRDDVITLLNIHLSISAKRTNEVMRILTIFSAFFLPLTFVVGVYGMNFDIMPELRHPYGYYFTLAFMAAICGAIFTWFKRKGWM